MYLLNTLRIILQINHTFLIGRRRHPLVYTLTLHETTREEVHTHIQWYTQSIYSKDPPDINNSHKRPGISVANIFMVDQRYRWVSLSNAIWSNRFRFQNISRLSGYVRPCFELWCGHAVLCRWRRFTAGNCNIIQYRMVAPNERCFLVPSFWVIYLRHKYIWKFQVRYEQSSSIELLLQVLFKLKGNGNKIQWFLS